MKYILTFAARNIIDEQFMDILNQGVIIEGLINIHGEEKELKTKVAISLEGRI